MNNYGNIPESTLYIKIDGLTLRHWIDSFAGFKVKSANYIVKHLESGEPYFESFYADSKHATLSLVNTPYGQVLVHQCKIS